jgi:plastocyanin
VTTVKTFLLILLAAASLGLFAACTEREIDPDSAPAVGVTEVVVKDMAFSPQEIEVPAGTTVTWRFQDGDTPHDVKGDGFASALMRSGSFTHTFDAPGSYDYRCTLHGQMKGRVIVTE